MNIAKSKKDKKENQKKIKNHSKKENKDRTPPSCICHVLIS